MKYGRVLVTGGTGSFGNRMVEKLVKENWARSIIVMSRDELKQDDMEKEYSDVEFMLGDVRDFDSVKAAMRGVNFVFHAAALKQVPRCEAHPIEAIRTNVLGAQNVMRAATESGTVEAVTALSTDKAVAPVNVMGMTKALAERIVTNWKSGDSSGSLDGKRFICVRYGNVIGSRGSVVPFFKRKVEKKETLQVTDPNMTRFMLTLPQAIDFILNASDACGGGEVFVPKLPSIRIEDLAKIMSKGRVPIEVTGIRPGEKVHEVMVSEEEAYRCYDVDRWFVVAPTIQQENFCVLGMEPTNKCVSSDDFVLEDYEYWEALLESEGLMP